MSDVSVEVQRKLLETTDAQVWADEFIRARSNMSARVDDVPVDRKTMVTWFANAIETGRTHGGKMTVERFESIANAALEHEGGAAASGRMVAGAFLSAVMDFSKTDEQALSNVIALTIGSRGLLPTDQDDEDIFKRAAAAAIRVLEGNFVDLKQA